MSTAPPDAILLDRVHLRITGPDAERYLNGQVTQNLSDLAKDSTRYTFVCDGKGRILFDAYLTRLGDDFLLDAPLSLSEAVITRLDRYLIADDCELINETGQWAIVHRFLSNPGEKEGAINRFGSPGQDTYLPREEALKLIANEDPESLENRRIAHGIPAQAELFEAFPAETGREDEAVSFHKGCYLGQEVISRMKRAGRTNQNLVRLTLSQTTEQTPIHFTQTEGGKPVLKVTSISSHANPEGYFPALGLLSRKADPEAHFTCSEQTEILLKELILADEQEDGQ